jgi:NADP-dependent 3-hydroxy acid dehydrogenase YdfG
VSPGAVTTEFAEASDFPDFPGVVPDYIKEIPFLQSKDIADAVIYVLGTPPHVQVRKLYSMYKLRCKINQPTPHLVSPS